MSVDHKHIIEMKQKIAETSAKKLIFTPHIGRYDWSYNPRTEMFFLNVAWANELEGPADG